MKLLLLVAGLASMRTAIERGDLDEAVRQGELAGPAVVDQALRAHDRATQLAGIAAAPAVEDAAELLPALARVAAGPDRRTAIPAARAARPIARTLAALDTAAALAEPGALGFDLGVVIDDPDPALRAAAIALVPQPAPASVRAQLATAILDADDRVALAAAQALCADLVEDAPGPVLAAIGAPGLARIRTLVTTAASRGPIRDAARCLAADRSPESAAALKAMPDLLRPVSGH